MKSSLVGRRTSQPVFEPSRSRQADTFISYQGQRPCIAAVPAPDLRLWRSAAQNGAPKSEAGILLDRLLALYWQDGVTQGEAAYLLGLRKETFAELADLRMGEAALERAAMRYYRAAFYRLFPRCNPAAVRQARFATRKLKPCSHAKNPTAREVALVTPPQRHTLRELVPSPRAADAEVAQYLAAHPVPLHRRFVEEDDDETGTENGVLEVKYV